jgi:protein tyrosine phosphatase (PTP) superfamily phosphohydrolase (DUF442 family)
MTALNAITNYVPITEDIGTSGQPTKEQFADIAAAGYQLLINLALPTSDHAISNEGSLVTELGMSYWHLPVKFDAPTLQELQLFCATLEAWRGKKVWVHCVVNARVSAFVYQYLRHVRGTAPEAARSPILKQWEPKMDAVWQTFIGYNQQDVLTK